MPGLADAFAPKPAPAVQAPPTRAVTAAPPSGNGSPAAAATKATVAAAPGRSEAPAGQHAAPGRPDAPTATVKQSASAKAAKGDEQEWWQE